MNHYETIRKLSRIYNKSIREISKETGHHRNTIRKVLSGIEPTYKKSKTPKSTVMDAYASVIHSWLISDQSSHKKQRHTATRIYDRLVEEYGFTGSQSRVREWVREKKKELGYMQVEAMVPLVPQSGKEAEIDWGDVEIILKGCRIKAKLFVMRSRYSGKIFSRVYLKERQIMFFDAHIHAFNYFGGIYSTLVYDNLTSAVQKVLKGHGRQEQESFISFRSYYNFESRFCSPGKGHEKGGVEGGVGYVRRNFLVPVPEIDSLEELNEKLLNQCYQHSQKLLTQKGKTHKIEDAFEQEKQSLISIPPIPFENKILKISKVTLYQIIQVEKNMYSVPSEYCRSEVNVHLSCDEIKIFYKDKEIGRHARSYEEDNWVLNPRHYLKTLERKPGAFNEALPILQWKSSWPSIYAIFLEKLRLRKGESKGTKEFIRIIRLLEKHEDEKLVTAMELANESHTWDEDSVKQLLNKGWSEHIDAPSLDKNQIPSIMNLSLEETDLSQYNILLN